jgi:hypothetical protein
MPEILQSATELSTRLQNFFLITIARRAWVAIAGRGIRRISRPAHRPPTPDPKKPSTSQIAYMIPYLPASPRNKHASARREPFPLKNHAHLPNAPIVTGSIENPVIPIPNRCNHFSRGHPARVVSHPQKLPVGPRLNYDHVDHSIVQKRLWP